MNEGPLRGKTAAYISDVRPGEAVVHARTMAEMNGEVSERAPVSGFSDVAVKTRSVDGVRNVNDRAHLTGQ